jgi:hypothetical protein
VIYEVMDEEKIVIVAAVLRAARDERAWQERVKNRDE